VVCVDHGDDKIEDAFATQDSHVARHERFNQIPVPVRRNIDLMWHGVTVSNSALESPVCATAP
jgi:hypothetical protein